MVKHALKGPLVLGKETEHLRNGKDDLSLWS